MAPHLRGPRVWAGSGGSLGSRKDRLERVFQGGAFCSVGPPGPPLTPSPACPPQNTSQDLLGEALAQHIRQQIDARGDHELSHYSLAGDWGHRMGTSHVSVLGEDGSAVAATSTINTPCVYPGGRRAGPTLLPLDLSLSAPTSALSLVTQP